MSKFNGMVFFCSDTAQLNMNGHISDGDSTGYSSDDEFRYPPQMVLTPIPGSSPIPSEDNNNNLNNQPVKPPPPFTRFSFEVSCLVPRSHRSYTEELYVK